MAELLQVDAWRVEVTYRAGTAREDHAFHAGCELGNMIVRMNFAINIEFADTPGDELGVLRAKVKNEDAFGHGRFLETAKLVRRGKGAKAQRQKVFKPLHPVPASAPAQRLRRAGRPRCRICY